MDKSTFICRAKHEKTGAWITGYYVNLNDKVYLIPDNASGIYPVPVKEDSVNRYTGYTDTNGKKIFANDLILAGKWKSRNGEVTAEYAGIVKVIDTGSVYELERYENLVDCFICGCDEFLDELKQEYFMEVIGNADDDMSRAYEVWYSKEQNK